MLRWGREDRLKCPAHPKCPFTKSPTPTGTQPVRRRRRTRTSGPNASPGAWCGVLKYFLDHNLQPEAVTKESRLLSHSWCFFSEQQVHGAGGGGGHPGDGAAPGEDPTEPPAEGEPGAGAAEAPPGRGRAGAGGAEEEEGGEAPCAGGGGAPQGGGGAAATCQRGGT